MNIVGGCNVRMVELPLRHDLFDALMSQHASNSTITLHFFQSNPMLSISFLGVLLSLVRSRLLQSIFLALDLSHLSLLLGKALLHKCLVHLGIATGAYSFIRVEAVLLRHTY